MRNFTKLDDYLERAMEDCGTMHGKKKKKKKVEEAMNWERVLDDVAGDIAELEHFVDKANRAVRSAKIKRDNPLAADFKNIGDSMAKIKKEITSLHQKVKL